MILSQEISLALLGVVLGLGGPYMLMTYLESRMKLSNRLYGVKVTDPLTSGLTAVLLRLAALGACDLPARRATKVGPMVPLRYESSVWPSRMEESTARSGGFASRDEQSRLRSGHPRRPSSLPSASAFGYCLRLMWIAATFHSPRRFASVTV